MDRRCRQLFRTFLLLMLMAFSALGEDYYEVLGLNFVDRPSESDIKRAYHRMALQHHPDKVAKEDVERAQQDFIKIAAAYEVLGDSAKRIQYDNMRSAHAAEQQQQREKQEQRRREETGSSFGGGSRGFYREEDPPPGDGRQEKSTDFFFHVDVSLEAIFTGAQASFSTQVAIVCPMCAGSGRCRVHSPLIDGSSDVGSDLQTAHQLAVMHENHYHEGICPKCGGLGRLPHDIHQSFYIPPGAHEGMKARIEGTANAQVLVFSTTHDRFIRRDNIHLDHILIITSNEAQLGWSREIVHLDGRILRVSSGRPSTDGDVFLVPGEGMPVFGSPWQKGDLFVNVSVSMDDTVLLSERSRILLLPHGGSTCSSAGLQGLQLLFAPDALGSGLILQERRLRSSDAFIALLLQGDNVTVYTHLLSHDVLLYGIDLPLRGTSSSAITVYVSCFYANGQIMSSLFHQPGSQSSALNVDTWRTLHFSSPDPMMCPSAARISVQVNLSKHKTFAPCSNQTFFNYTHVIFCRFLWQEIVQFSCSSYIHPQTLCFSAHPALPLVRSCASPPTRHFWCGYETTAATAFLSQCFSRIHSGATFHVIERL
jgi:DnaJ family protein A protein 2